MVTPLSNPPSSAGALSHTRRTRPGAGPPHIRALLIDISGTLLVGHAPISNAPHALSRLRTANIPFRLCTNTSKESNASLVARLSQAGLGDGERLGREVWSSVGALGDVMKGLGVKRPYMLLSPSAMEECMPAYITSTNTSTSTNANPNVHRAAATTSPRSTDLTTPSTSSSSSPSSSSPTDPPPPPQSESRRVAPQQQQQHDAVIVGLAPAMLDYDHLNTAFRILIGEREGVETQIRGSSESTSQSDAWTASPERPPLIALHKARYFASTAETSSGKTQTLSLGPGPFVSALEEAANVKAIVVGKPSRTFFEGSLRDLFPPRDGNGTNDEVEEEENENEKGRLHRNEHEHEDSNRQWTDVAVIGDDILTDLGEGAIELGMWRVLVKTGKYRTGDECRPGVVPPDQVCESFEAFVDWLLGEGNDGGR